MKQSEETIDELPAPGEPLTPHIHEDNQRLIDEEIAERAARVRGRLTWWQRFKLERRYWTLHRILNKAGYNRLITERYQLHQTCTRLAHEIKSTSSKERKAMHEEMVTAARKGKAINARLSPLRALAFEFETVVDRLKIHADVIDWEKKDAEDKTAFQQEAKVWVEQIKATMRQDPRVHHAGVDSKGRHFCHIPKFEQILFKEDRVLYQIRTTYQGFIQRLLGRWSSALPYGVTVTDLIHEETIANLSAGCNRVVTVERSRAGTNIFYSIARMDSPDGIPKKVLFSKVIKWYPIEEHRKTPWCVGISNDRKAIWYNFEDYPHVLVAGASGGGKSNHLNSMIATLASMNRPDEVQMVMVDLKGGVEFSHWSGLKHLMGKIVKTPAGILTALQLVREIMENRLTIFESMRVKNLTAYNARAAEPMTRIIVFIDELATLIGLGELTTDIHTELRVISAQGRAAGIHLVPATQHPSVDVLPGWIKTNMNIRMATKMPTQIASQIILDTGTAAFLPAVPGRIVCSIGRAEIIAQSPYISDAEIAQAVRASQMFPDTVEVITPEPVTVKEKFTAADAIEIALTKLNGSLSAKRIHEIVGNDVITRRNLEKMVHEIIEEPDIEHSGTWYRVRKRGKGYYLETLPQIHNEEVSEDTDEFHGIESVTEDEELEEVAV